jgi:hypothetical protein
MKYRMLGKLPPVHVGLGATTASVNPIKNIFAAISRAVSSSSVPIEARWLVLQRTYTVKQNGYLQIGKYRVPAGTNLVEFSYAPTTGNIWAQLGSGYGIGLVATTIKGLTPEYSNSKPLGTAHDSLGKRYQFLLQAPWVELLSAENTVQRK